MGKKPDYSGGCLRIGSSGRLRALNAKKKNPRREVRLDAVATDSHPGATAVKRRGVAGRPRPSGRIQRAEVGDQGNCDAVWVGLSQYAEVLAEAPQGDREHYAIPREQTNTD